MQLKSFRSQPFCSLSVLSTSVAGVIKKSHVVAWFRTESNEGGRLIVYHFGIVSWRNVKRKKSRAALLAASAAMTAFILFASYFFVYSMERSVQATSSRLQADLFVVPKGHGNDIGDLVVSGQKIDFTMSESVTEEIQVIPGVTQVSSQLFLETIHTVCCGVEGDFPVVAFNPEDDFTLQEWVVAPELDFGKEDIIIGAEAGGENYIYDFHRVSHVEWVTLFGKEFRVKNILFPTGTGTDETIFMHIDTARELAERDDNALELERDAISLVLVNTEDGQAKAVQHQIEAMDSGIDVVPGNQLNELIRQQVFPVQLLSVLMIIVMVIMSGLQVMMIISAIISERKKEIGMMRTMGATRWMTFKILAGEIVIVSSVGATLGSLLAGALLYDNRGILFKLFQLPLLFPDWTSGITIGVAALAVVLITAVIAAYIPISHHLKYTPYSAVREGEK